MPLLGKITMQEAGAVSPIQEAEDHVCVDGDIRLILVCDSSVEIPDDNPRDWRAGMSLVSKRLSPGTPEHGSLIHQAWAISPAHPDAGMELFDAVAFLQAMWQANEELRRAIRERRITHDSGAPGQAGSLSTGGKTIKVDIVTRNRKFLELLLQCPDSDPDEATSSAPSPPAGAPGTFATNSPSGAPVEPPSMTTKEILNDIVKHAIWLTQDLQELPDGFRVELTLLCAESSSQNSGMKLQPQAFYLSRHACHHRQHIHIVNGLRMPFAPSVLQVYKKLNIPLVAESAPGEPSDHMVYILHVFRTSPSLKALYGPLEIVQHMVEMLKDLDEKLGPNDGIRVEVTSVPAAGAREADGEGN